MRQDQYERLQKIEEQLAEVFIAEADPAAWPMPGTPSANLSAEHRKERYQFKRAAAETAMLLVRTQNLISAVQGAPNAPHRDAPSSAPEPKPDDAEAEMASALDREIGDAERQAERMRADLIKRAQKAARGDQAAG